MQEINNDQPVSIVIANYNGKKYLDVCLRSVLRSKYTNFELLITDDGSIDESIKIINSYIKKDKRIRLFKNKKNIGAAASRNIAIKKAKGEIIVFLDNDTEVHPNWLNELVRTLGNDKRIGGAQSLLLDFKERDRIQMAGGLLIPSVIWLAPFHHWDSYKKVKNKLKERDIIAISAALAVKKEVLEKVGGFDELEAVTTEDLDFCWRIWIAGYKIKLSPRSVVYHWTKRVEDRSYIGNLEKIYFHLAKNSFRSIIKNYENINILLFLTTSLFINFGRGIVYLFFKLQTDALVGTIRAIIWNFKIAPNTYKERNSIRRYRKYRDKKIMNTVFSKESLLSIIQNYYT